MRSTLAGTKGLLAHVKHMNAVFKAGNEACNYKCVIGIEMMRKDV